MIRPLISAALLSGAMLSGVLFPNDRALAEEAKPAFSEEVRGDWYMLAAHQNNKNIATGIRVNSRVAISADVATWHDPENSNTPLVSAKCVRAAAAPDPKNTVRPE